MKYTYPAVLLTLTLLLSGVSGYAQKLKYDVVLFGNKIGETIIEQKDSGGIRRYILSSHSEAKVLFTDKKSSMIANVLYDKEGKLFFSYFEHIKEDEKILTQARWDKTKLLIDRNGKKTEIAKPVNNSVLELYFTEPKKTIEVFSERLGRVYSLIREAEGVYDAVIDGVTNIYTYKNGKLIELEMKKGIGSVYLRLAQ